MLGLVALEAVMTSPIPRRSTLGIDTLTSKHPFRLGAFLLVFVRSGCFFA
jgi:hypothetical protein